MNRKETLGETFGKLLDTANKGFKKVSDAFQEEITDSNSLSCIKKEILDFDAIESDIAALHQQLQSDGHEVIGNHIILNEQTNLFVIKVYSQQKKKNFVNTITTPVKLVINLPPDIARELKHNGSVELNINLD